MDISRQSVEIQLSQLKLGLIENVSVRRNAIS